MDSADRKLLQHITEVLILYVGEVQKRLSSQNYTGGDSDRGMQCEGTSGRLRKPECQSMYLVDLRLHLCSIFDIFLPELRALL